VPAITTAPAQTPAPIPPLDDDERLADEIADLAAHLHAATYRLLVLLREYDAREAWGWGFASCAHWLSWRTGIAPGAAREKVRVARALGPLPLISAAMERGELSYSKVRALTRIATEGNEADLLEFARCGTASHVERVVRAWRRVDRLEEAEDERLRHESRRLSLYPDVDGSWVLRGRLDAEVGALLEKAIEAAGEELYGRRSPDGLSPEQRRADAVGLLAEIMLASPDVPAGTSTPRRPRRADRFQVVLHVDAEALVEDAVEGQSVLAGGGQRVPAETSRRIACDADVVEIHHDAAGTPLDVGRRRRTVPIAIRRALEHRDRHCRFPGCENRHCDAHHVVHWADGGGTELDNLVLLCRRHHRAVHEGGFRVEVAGRGEVQFFRPGGARMEQAPVAPTLASNSVERLRGGNPNGIGPWTPTPAWYGERLDLDWAIYSLRGSA
jgi:hypothetical protein